MPRQDDINRNVRVGADYQVADEADDQTIGDDLTVGGDAAVAGDVAAGDDVTVADDLTVTDTSTLNGPVLFGSTLLSDVQATETVAVDKTLDEGDSGVFQIVTVDAKTVTLPATALGLTYTIINGGADGAVLVTVSPNAADKIHGGGFTASDNKDALNTKATAKKGDMIRLLGDGAAGWFIQELRGIWAREG